MAVTVYKSTDVGAAALVLNGLAGSLITVLNGCLVNGYSGKTAAGWTKTDGTLNRVAYRPNSGARHYFRIDDGAVGTLAAGKEAFLRGYETMTNVDTPTGTNPFPTTTQLANGLFIRKSRSQDATARKWIIVADDRTAYVFINSDDYSGWSGFMIGEFYSLKSTADAYRSIVIGRGIQEVAATPIANPANENLELFAAITASNLGHFVPRSYSEEPNQAVPVGKHGNAAHSTTVMAGITAFPNPVDGGVYVSQIWIHEATSNPIMRGRMRGLWHFLHPVGVAVNDGDTWSGTGALAGKTFLAVKPTAAGNGIFVIETSNTWETN